MTTSVRQMIEAANAAVPRITPARAAQMISEGNTLVVDVREAAEVEVTGMVAGSVRVARGMLEFHADPQAKNMHGRTPLDETTVHNASKVAKLLVQRVPAVGRRT